MLTKIKCSYCNQSASVLGASPGPFTGQGPFTDQASYRLWLIQENFQDRSPGESDSKFINIRDSEAKEGPLEIELEGGE